MFKRKKILRLIEQLQIEAVANLLNLGQSPHRQKSFLCSFESPLVIAVSKNSFELVKLLLKHGARIDEEGTNGITPLRLACYMDNSKMVEFLLQNNANPNYKSKKSGRTNLGVAVARNYEDIVKLLISNGADVLPVLVNQAPRIRPDLLEILFKVDTKIPPHIYTLWNKNPPFH